MRSKRVYVIRSVDTLLDAPMNHKRRWSRERTLFYAREQRCYWYMRDCLLAWYRP